ncbi:MAG: amidohydrolase, partial [Bacteroidota bacterium]
MKKLLLAGICFSFAACLTSLKAQHGLESIISEKAEAIEAKVVEWRRHLHANPELSNREFKTAEYVANHLKALGMDVQTGIAHTGVVALLEGGKPGPVVGLRADMDALPVTERVDIPFASKVISEYNGIETGVMHACGHDTHVAILMGVAEILSEVKADIPGTIKFIFQPAEEGAPVGEEGGAKLMVEEGVMENPKVEAIFGLHINSQLEVGHIGYKPGGSLAAADRFRILVRGRQSHGSQPWGGVDPIVASAQIVMGLQTIISRQTELTKEAAVISVGLIRGGIRNNIIPEECEMIGTIRTLDT